MATSGFDAGVVSRPMSVFPPHPSPGRWAEPGTSPSPLGPCGGAPGRVREAAQGPGQLAVSLATACIPGSVAFVRGRSDPGDPAVDQPALIARTSAARASTGIVGKVSLPMTGRRRRWSMIACHSLISVTAVLPGSVARLFWSSVPAGGNT